MKYNFLTLGLLVFAVNAFGQTGIGTSNPAATLQVTGNSTTVTSADGIIPPIISRTNLMAKTSYTSSQKGAILYVDDISGTVPSVGSATEFVTNIGYYYFDGVKWMKFIKDSDNIYNTNGSLTNPRTVTQGPNTLTFTSTATNSFSVDGSTFSVDAANNRVGIGTTAPVVALDINGNARVSGLADGSDGTLFPKNIVAKNDGTLGYSSLSISSYQLKIPPHNAYTTDFTNHSNTSFDSDNWWVISKTSVASSNSVNGFPYKLETFNASRMTIVYEYQGTAVIDPTKIYPQLTAGNDQSYPDVYSPSFVKMENIGGKTRMTVSVARVDTPLNNWQGSFLLNVLFIVKG